MSDWVLFGAGEPAFWVAAIFVGAGIVLFTIVMLLMKQYKRWPSIRLLVIFG